MQFEKTPGTWWKTAVLYQIYVRSFADSNADGVGDLRGIIDRLDYLRDLGVGGIWLSPVNPSPDRDWGYDVSDYRAIQTEFGDLDTFRELLREAETRGIRVLLDLVPNHTSDQAAWFVEAKTSKDSRYRDWYVFRPPAADGGPPNNWLSVFGNEAWTLDEASGEYFLHNFLSQQPDLNWWNDEVRQEFEDILRFWFDMGVGGFRIDVCHGIVKDRELRDNPATAVAAPYAGDPPEQVQKYNMNRPEVHDLLRSWRELADEYDPGAVLLGETHSPDVASVAAYYGTNDDELHMAFNFHFTRAKFDATALRTMIESYQEVMPETGWPVWTLSNHDISRFPTRWCDGNQQGVRVALMILLMLRGTPVLYYGDEIGMEDVDVPRDQLKDPVGQIPGTNKRNRDPARTPMHWDPTPLGGFTGDGADPWLPLGDTTALNVHDQHDDPSSTWTLTRDLIALRNGEADLLTGAYASLDSSDPRVWAWQRGEGFAVVVNVGDGPATHGGLSGEVALDTANARRGASIDGTLELAPWDGVVLRLR